MPVNPTPEIRPGDKVILIVREPQDQEDARATREGNYEAMKYLGEIESALLNVPVPQMVVRWHMPATLGYDTLEGTVSTMIHVADSVWLETRRKPRNVVASIQRIPEEEYQKLLTEAATGRPGR
jgi:hypothetical protein